MWWNGWQPRLWGGGGVIGIIILPALKLKLIMVVPMLWELEWSAPHRILIILRVTMVPTLQLPLKPWPDPPLVLQVLLDVYKVWRFSTLSLSVSATASISIVRSVTETKPDTPSLTKFTLKDKGTIEMFSYYVHT